MTKVLALNTDGQLTYCTAPEELRGKGRCNHIFHQNNGESKEDFLKRVSNMVDTNNDAIKKEIIDKYINDEDDEVRAALAKAGYGLDKLVDDSDFMVRMAVAEQGYGLDKFVNDDSPSVREIVAEQGYGLDKLVNDSIDKVRVTVANKGYGLDKLVNDKDRQVRAAVARQGYGLDKLINDEDWLVRKTALKALIKSKKIIGGINVRKNFSINS